MSSLPSINSIVTVYGKRGTVIDTWLNHDILVRFNDGSQGWYELEDLTMTVEDTPR